MCIHCLHYIHLPTLFPTTSHGCQPSPPHGRACSTSLFSDFVEEKSIRQ
jgi:hypothetical protein